jgi:hypothetical protein
MSERHIKVSADMKMAVVNFPVNITKNHKIRSQASWLLHQQPTVILLSTQQPTSCDLNICAFADYKMH